MARPKKFTEKEVIDALNAKRGLITHTADFLGCEPETVTAYAKKYPAVKRTIMKYRTKRVDTAELMLDKAIQNGEAWAIAMVLKTLGKKRGYTELNKHEISGPKGGPIQQQQVFSHDAAVAAIASRSGSYRDEHSANQNGSNGEALG